MVVARLAGGIGRALRHAGRRCSRRTAVPGKATCSARSVRCSSSGSPFLASASASTTPGSAACRAGRRHMSISARRCLIIATLHAGFQVGWNLHTLAYVLMVIVIFSGFFGLYNYLQSSGPLISKNREGGSPRGAVRRVVRAGQAVAHAGAEMRAGSRDKQSAAASSARRWAAASMRSCSAVTSRYSCAAPERRCATPTNRP